MANSGGKITAPVSVANDIAPVLGVGSYSLRYLCYNQHGRINMWAKYKPVVHPANANITDEQRRSVAFGLSFTEGGNHDYGIFRYSAPTGKDASPFRCLDFNGYNHYETTGIRLKNMSVSKDIFNDKTDLVLPLEDSTSKITCYDLRDTLLNGFKLSCLLTSATGNGKYWVGYIDINRQSLSFTVPFIDLTTKLGAGTYNIVLNAYKNGSTIGFFPIGYERGTLKLTSNTGITASLWPNIRLVDNGSYYDMSSYYAGNGYRILNLTNQNFVIDTLNLLNGSSYSINNNNIFVQFRWAGNNVEYYSYVPLRVGTNLGDWSISAGSSNANRYGCISSQIPKMTNPSEGNIQVTTNIVYKHTDGYYYNVTDYVTLRLKKDTGPTPSSVVR